MLQLHQYLFINMVHLQQLTLKKIANAYICYVINLSPTKIAKIAI
tara:strand:+ start:177 stop:311 length:135 start_codon:yes stop_codon:yes gene_type:complete